MQNVTDIEIFVVPKKPKGNRKYLQSQTKYTNIPVWFLKLLIPIHPPYSTHTCPYPFGPALRMRYDWYHPWRKYDFDVLQSYKFLQCRPVRPVQQSWEGLRGSEAIKRMVQTSETKGRNFHSDRMLLIFLFFLLIQRSTATNSIFTWKFNCWEGEESLQNFVLGILVT